MLLFVTLRTYILCSHLEIASSNTITRILRKLVQSNHNVTFCRTSTIKYCSVCNVIPSTSCHGNIIPETKSPSIIYQRINDMQETINKNLKAMDHLNTSDTEDTESSQVTNNPDIEEIKDGNNPDIEETQDGNNPDIEQIKDGNNPDTEKIKDTNNPDIDQIKVAWASEQASFLSSIVEVDTEDWMAKKELGLVGGLDISFIVGDDCNACACYVVIDEELNVVYKDLKMVQLTAPYVPGFLAFRESEFLCNLVKHQMETEPRLTPSVLLVDGNGRLHPRRVGVACHIGLTTGIPAIGVAKNLHQLPEEGDVLKRGPQHEAVICGLVGQGDHAILHTDAGEVVGAVVKTNSSSKRPVYVSVGSGISLETAVWVVGKVSTSRIPEPTRQADILSREFLRVNHPTQRQIQATKKNQKKKGNVT